MPEELKHVWRVQIIHPPTKHYICQSVDLITDDLKEAVKELKARLERKDEKCLGVCIHKDTSARLIKWCQAAGKLENDELQRR